MNQAEGLSQIHEYWKENCQCELKHTGARAVFGHGNPLAKIIFIGEAPGKKEDETGVPFMGAAGKFLNEMLKAIGMKRDDIYITNVVKYRPPENRDPLPLEKEACRAWLTEELNFINPKLIVFLGRHSMSNFFPNEKISEVHGKLLNKKFEYIKCENFLPLYHPAAALYNGSMRDTLMTDFKKIPKILSKLSSNS